MGRIKMIVAAIVGWMLVLVTFNLFPTLLGQVDGLAGPFFDSAVDTNRQHFTKVFLGVSGNTVPGPMEYNVTTEVFGGSGATLFGSEVTITLPAIATTAAAVEAGATIYNERGRAIGTTNAVGANNSIASANYTLNPGIVWQTAPPILTMFGNINAFLLGLFPVVTSLAFLSMSAMILWRYGTGRITVLSGHIVKVGLTLVFVIVFLALGPTAISSVLTESQYATVRWPQDILELVVAIIPSVYMASILGVTAITISRTVNAAADGTGGSTRSNVLTVGCCEPRDGG